MFFAIYAMYKIIQKFKIFCVIQSMFNALNTFVLEVHTDEKCI